MESARESYNINVVAGDYFIYDFGQACFDVVVLRHVLEHLENPLLAMRRIRALVKSNGYVFLEFPNIESPGMRLKRYLTNMGIKHKRYPENYIPGHANEFCFSSFCRLIQLSGFEIVRWETYSARPVYNFIFNRLHIGNKVRTIIKAI